MGTVASAEGQNNLFPRLLSIPSMYFVVAQNLIVMAEELANAAGDPILTGEHVRFMAQEELHLFDLYAYERGIPRDVFYDDQRLPFDRVYALLQQVFQLFAPSPPSSKPPSASPAQLPMRSFAGIVDVPGDQNGSGPGIAGPSNRDGNALETSAAFLISGATDPLAPIFTVPPVIIPSATMR